MIRNFLLLLAAALLGLTCKTAAPPFQSTLGPETQIPIRRIDMMPNQPAPYVLKDWRKTALNFDRYVYDFNKKGQYQPFIWLDEQKRNFPETTFGLYTAIGDVREGPAINKGENHEALGALGSILGATLVGIDKSKQDGKNYVRMARNYFNRDNGWNIVMNFTNKGAHIGGGYGNDYWYDVFNNVLFYAVGNFYPKEEGYSDIMRTVAEQFYRSDSILGNSYSYSFFDFKEMKPGKNHIPPQEDVAAGYAFILYSAYVKFGDEKYLRAARHALDILHAQKESRCYEIVMPFGAYVGARLNAEAGGHYDLSRFINWTFDGNATNRQDWGVIVGKWGGYDVSGIAGSTTDRGGYGFAMNTFDLAWPLTAMLRYDQRYAHAVGKWLLNASNAARLFYPYGIPDSLQAEPGRKALTGGAIAYEGMSKIPGPGYESRPVVSPFAQGDGPNWAPGNPPESRFSLYGSGHVGIFGGVIQPTDVPRILQVDCLATDMFRRGGAYPTYLVYNPYAEKKTVTVNAGSRKVDLYDAVSRQIVARGVKRKATVALPADAARLLVLVPAGSRFEVKDGKLWAGGVVVDYRYQ